jgi:GAF domain-containing protein
MNRNLLALSNDILEAGRRRYCAMMAIVSQVRGEVYEVVAVSSATMIPCPGDSYPLNSVYCREVVRNCSTIATTEIKGAEGRPSHPLYDFIPCEFYIGSPILVEGKVWGTLNFTSLEKRSKPFSAEDILFNEKNASLIALAITEGAAR